MNYDNLLIVTYGRTGSTLLMGVLNSIPGVKIRGENHNFCHGLFLSHQALLLAKKQSGAAEAITDPFFGADVLSSQNFLKDARALVRHQLLSDTADDVQCFGFKEIRYMPGALNVSGKYTLVPYLNFLSEIFGNPLFVFLTRDHEDVADSAFWKNHPKDKLLKDLLRFENEARHWAADRSNTHWIDYRNLVARDKVLRSLFSKLGAPYDDEQVAQVMAKEHSYGNKIEHVAHTRKNSRALEVATVESPEEIIAAFVDKFPNFVEENISFNVSGVIVLANSELNDGKKIWCSDDRVEILESLDSPWYGEKYKEIHSAAKSRFSIHGLQLEQGKSVEIGVKIADGSIVKLFSLKFK